MVKLTTQPADAIIGTMINDWDTAVFNGGLTRATPANHMRGNILKADDFRTFKPHDTRTTEYIVVGLASGGIIRNYGAYSHFYARIPVFVEIHSVRSDTQVEAWKEECWLVLQTRRKNITNLYSDYRKIWLETFPLDVSAGTRFKWVINFELEMHVNAYP